MLLQNALDLHHPRSTESALAVAQAQAESRRRARGLAAVRGAVGPRTALLQVQCSRFELCAYKWILSKKLFTHAESYQVICSE
jgi:hypothetical protein